MSLFDSTLKTQETLPSEIEDIVASIDLSFMFRRRPGTYNPYFFWVRFVMSNTRNLVTKLTRPHERRDNPDADALEKTVLGEESFGFLLPELSFRTTKYARDEPVCLATLLDLDTSKLKVSLKPKILGVLPWDHTRQLHAAYLVLLPTLVCIGC